MSSIGNKSDDECSVIGDKGEISFVDYQQDKSVWNYNPQEEGLIVVSVPFPFIDGKPQSVLVGETVFDSITLTNTTSEAVDLWTKIFASTPQNSFTLSLMKPPSPDDEKGKRAFLEGFELEDRMLQPGEMLTVWLSCKPMVIGVHTSVVHFDVGCDRIERVVNLLSEDKISQSLASKKPYSRTTRKKQFNADSYVAGSRPTRAKKQGFRNRLPRYDIPKNIRELIESKKIPNAITQGLTVTNYASYFKTLLIMEEIQLEESMRNYDLECVHMWKKGHFISLSVPDLAERRPSLVHGDDIFAKLANADDATRTYQGYIHRVEADEVYLKFTQDFHLFHSNANLYNIRFTYNRVDMRRRYQAIDAAEHLERELLFPTESSENRLIETTPLVPISCNLNEEQMHSIEMILGCNGGPPYVIHGPPGTGKTRTIVEAILQIYKYHNNTRILACAPSNSAADHILEMLISEKAVQVRANEIFRLNASSRPFEDVKPEHICFCSFEDLIFKCPPLNALKRYRIIVSTYMSTSLLYAEGLGQGHFSHIFLDEAGQASEPESMVPLSNLCQKNMVVVLAGDPMQLGPVIFSRDAEAYGLGKSYLERLFECEPYCSGDKNYVTKLIRNYRCHPEILYLPSTLFYQGELIPCKESIHDTTSLMSLVNLNEGNDFPVLFFGIQGCDEREGCNPSWFNRIEVSKVIEIVQKLVTKGNLTELDIGVITPYRQQVLKIKKVLEDLDLADIKVGSVEQFQGQERKVIIVSTVRSTVKHNEFDRAHCLGFLTNPRRFNVSLTRAILLLIIVSNPHIITKDVHWNKLLWHCVDHDSYQGCALPERHELFYEHLGVENFTNDDEEKLQLSEGVAFDQEPFQAEITKPIKDEDEWSDGWR